MILLMIADDFTGALDTGVKMAEFGLHTTVTTDLGALQTERRKADVLVIDAETRHLPPDDAGNVVRALVLEAVQLDVPHIYKKTDSALRGNIGTELTALLEASGETQLPFLPALPEIGRVTVDGIHYISGKPVAESVFGQDPYEPVKQSRVSAIIGEHSAVPVSSLKAYDSGVTGYGIQVYDSRTQEELLQAGKALAEAGKLHICAGSAGFGAVLPEALGIQRKRKNRPALQPGLLVICGSVNPITREQLTAGRDAGFVYVPLQAEQVLRNGYWAEREGRRALNEIRNQLTEHEYMIVDSGAVEVKDSGLSAEKLRERISASLGEVFESLLCRPEAQNVLITGGDTLLQCMKQLDMTTLEPICELFPGVVLSEFEHRGISRYLISKSGGFGQKNLLPDLKEMLENDEPYLNREGGRQR